jgi:hypothetical protein
MDLKTSTYQAVAGEQPPGAVGGRREIHAAMLSIAVEMEKSLR